MSSAVTKEKELYSGKTSGLTFEAFDEKVISWCRKKYGDAYAVGLWENELDDIYNLDLADDEDNFSFELQCAKVYDVLCRKSVKNADHLHAKSEFWTKKYQVEFRQSCREEVFCHLEELCTGEACRQLRKQGVRKMAAMRDFFFRRFGAGQPELIQERVRLYLMGMPDHNGAAFPPRCDMEVKLDTLETEREYLIEMCPKDKRDAYQEGKEEQLIRIILNHLPAEYDAVVKSVRDLSRLRKYGEEGDIAAITNLEDNSRLNYSADWLQLIPSSVLNSSMPISLQKGDVTSQEETKRKRWGTLQCPSWMALTNLAQTLALAFDAGRKITELPMLPAKERKATFRKMRQNGSSVKLAKRKGPATAKAKARAKEKGKENSAEIGIGKVKEPEGKLANHLAPTTAKEMVIASGETTVVSPTMGLRGASGRQRQWQLKSPRKSKRSR
jgi:hypothetical protein